jgi:uncharacterized protein (UPF0147 family)
VSRVTIESELQHAAEAQAAGNAGLARVCARRAAGMAIREWSGKMGDALKQLGNLERDNSLPENIREAARRLSTKVQLDHTLPFKSDPIEEARMVIEYVEQERIKKSYL